MTWPQFWREFCVVFTRGTTRATIDYNRACLGHTRGKITSSELDERIGQLVAQALTTQ